MKLVLVHGRSQENQDPAALRARWIGALRTGFERAGVHAALDDVSFAYYGDILADLVAHTERDLPPDAADRAPETAAEYAIAQREILTNLVVAAGIPAELIDAELTHLRARDPWNWGWVLAAVRALSHIPGLEGAVIDLWLRDVALYLTDAATQRAVDRTVAAQLNADPFVLVAHSLGTVVAYNVLRSPLDRGACRGLVTLGSPLAIPAIRDRLHPPLTFPHNVTRWVNAYDPADIIALYPLDTRHFPTTPPIENHGDVTNSDSGHHEVTGYLTDRTVATAIAGLLGPE